jgi:outer membrane protein TolC
MKKISSYFTALYLDLMSTKCFVITILLFFYLNILQVPVVFSQSDSLGYYFELAMKNNPTVLQRFNEYHAALQKVPQVGALPDPQLEMGIFLTPMELISGNQVAEFKIMQMFPWFGVLKNAKDEMALMANAKYEFFLDSKLQVLYDLQLVWFDLYKVRQSIRISQKNVAMLKTIEQLTLLKFKYGSTSTGGGARTLPQSTGGMTSTPSNASGMNAMGGAPAPSSNKSSVATSTSPMGGSSSNTGLSDVYQIQIEAGNLENTIYSLKNEEKIVMARFNSLINRPLRSAVGSTELLPTTILDSAYLTLSEEQLYKSPMLRMLQYEQQSLDARKKMIDNMGYPMIGLGLKYNVINKSEMSTSPMNGSDMIMPMLSVTLPIYRKKYNAMQSEIIYSKTASQQNYQSVANSIHTSYFEALQLYSDAHRRMILFDSQRQLAEKSLDILIKTFSSSSSGLTDISRTRQQLFDYELKEVDALTDCNKAVAWIQKIIQAPKSSF